MSGPEEPKNLEKLPKQKEEISLISKEKAEEGRAELLPEDKEVKEEYIRKLNKGSTFLFGSLMRTEDFYVPGKFISDPDIREAAKRGIVEFFNRGGLEKGLKIKETFNFSDEIFSSSDIIKAIGEGIAKNLSLDDIGDVKEFIKNIPFSEKIGEAIGRGIKEGMLKALVMGGSENIFKIKKEFSVSEEMVTQVAKEGMIHKLAGGYIDDAIKIKDKFNLPQEFLSSPEIRQAAKEGIIRDLEGAGGEDAIKIMEKLSLPKDLISDPEIKKAAEKAVYTRMEQERVLDAFEFINKFSLDISVEDLEKKFPPEKESPEK